MFAVFLPGTQTENLWLEAGILPVCSSVLNQRDEATGTLASFVHILTVSSSLQLETKELRPEAKPDSK